MKTSNTAVSIVNLSNKDEAAKVSPVVLEAVLTAIGDSTGGSSAIELMEEIRKEQSFSYLIAGGVYRDAMVGGTIKDVDIFIYNVASPKSFQEVGRLLAQLTDMFVDKTPVLGYKDNEMISIRVGDFNLIYKEGSYHTGRTLLKSFTADVSMVGCDFPANSIDGPEILINPKGMANLLINKEVEFFLNSNSKGSRDYIEKISAKPWAKGFNLVYQNRFFKESVLNPAGGLGLCLDSAEYLSNPEMLIAINVCGVFDKDYKDFKRKHVIETDIYVSYSLEYSAGDDTSINLWSDYYREGVDNYDITSKLVWMSDRFKGEINSPWHLPRVEGLGFNRNIVSADIIFKKSLGIWGESELDVYLQKSYLTGWDCVYCNNDLDHKTVYDLWSKGNKRMVLKGSTHIEAMLSAYGLSGKVDPLIKKNSLQGFGSNFNLVARLKRALQACKSIKPKDISSVNSYVELLEVINWYSVLGVSYKLLSINMRSHDQLASKYSFDPIPVKFQPQIAKSKLLCAWLFETTLDVQNLAGWGFKTAKECIIASISMAYADLNVDAAKVFENPTLLEVYAYVQENPSKHVVHNFPDVNIHSGDLTLELLPKSDLSNLYIGDLTSCCQKLGGVGEKVCTEGWNDPNSVNYVFRLPSGRIAAHMWVWRDIEGNYVIDSIEGKSFSNTTDISELVLQFSQTVDKTVYVSNTLYGVTGAVHANLHGGMETVECLESITDYTYMDASPGSSILKLGKGCINLAIECKTFRML